MTEYSSLGMCEPASGCVSCRELVGSWRCRDRSEPLPVIRAAVFTGRNVLMVADPGVPPDSLGLFTVFREQDFEAAFPIVARLLPGALPESIGNLGGGESSPMLGIGTVPGLVQGGFVALVILDFEDFPFAAQIRRRDVVAA